MPNQYKTIWKIATKAATAQMSWSTLDMYSKKFIELRDQKNIRFVKTPDDVLKAQLEAWDKIIEDKGKDNPLFMEIINSQKSFMKRAVVSAFHYFNPFLLLDKYAAASCSISAFDFLRPSLRYSISSVLEKYRRLLLFITGNSPLLTLL